MIQIVLSTVDTGLMQANPQIGQNLQIIATLSGQAQVDTLSMGSPPVAGTTYTVTLNGLPLSYVAKAGDTAQTVLTAIRVQVVAAALPISSVVNGSGSGATLILTSTIPALAFTDTVSAGITLVATNANGGTRDIFLLQQVLNIQPQDYGGY